MAANGKHVIVGGLGNVGRHLQRVLLDHGKAVTVIDRPSAIASKLLQHPSVEFVPFVLGQQKQHKDNNNNALLEALRGAETAYSVVTPDVQHATLREFYQANHHGIEQLIQACQKERVPKLVYGSSIAVMNHFVAHPHADNVNEDHPLPEMDSYETGYDKTKRLGEDSVLQANDGFTLQTCALRFGGILASPNDFMCRESFKTYTASKTITTMKECQPIDTIAALDCSLALYQADQKMDNVAGRALFCSKDTSQTPLHANKVAEYLASNLKDCKLQYISPTVYDVVRTGFAAKHAIQSWYTHEQDMAGSPMHLYMTIANYEQSFDNTRAHEDLDWFPQLSWEQAVDQIIDEYHANANSSKTG